jgi:hypothetical protein
MDRREAVLRSREAFVVATSRSRIDQDRRRGDCAGRNRGPRRASSVFVRLARRRSQLHFITATRS